MLRDAWDLRCGMARADELNGPECMQSVRGEDYIVWVYRCQRIGKTRLKILKSSGMEGDEERARADGWARLADHVACMNQAQSAFVAISAPLTKASNFAHMTVG